MPLVVFEGVDGSGKSTLSRALAEALGAHRKAFPQTDGTIGRLIRAHLAGVVRIEKQALQHLFIADGLDADPDVADRTSRGELVIFDRHPTISGWVYQVETTPIDFVQQISIAHCFTPIDIVFIVDVPAKVAVERLAAREGERNSYDEASLDVVEGRRSRYMAYRVMHRQCFILDGTAPVVDNLAQVRQLLKGLRAARDEQN
jgi:dTMP kinase